MTDTDLRPEDLDAPEAGISPEKFAEIEAQKAAAAKAGAAEGEAQAALVEGITEEVDEKKQQDLEKIDDFFEKAFESKDHLKKVMAYKYHQEGFLNPPEELRDYPEKRDEFWERAMEMMSDLRELLSLWVTQEWLKPNSREVKDKIKNLLFDLKDKDEQEFYFLGEKTEKFLDETIDFPEEDREKMFIADWGNMYGYTSCLWDNEAGSYRFTVCNSRNGFMEGQAYAPGKTREEAEEIYKEILILEEPDKSIAAFYKILTKLEELTGENIGQRESLTKKVLEARRAKDLEQIEGLSTEKMAEMFREENVKGFSPKATDRLHAYYQLRKKLERIDQEERSQLEDLDEATKEGKGGVKEIRRDRSLLIKRMEEARDDAEAEFNQRLEEEYQEREDNVRKLSQKGLIMAGTRHWKEEKKFRPRPDKREELKDEVTQMAIEKQNRELYERKPRESVRAARERVQGAIINKLLQLINGYKDMKSKGRELKNRDSRLTGLFKGYFEGENTFTETGEAQPNSEFLKDLLGRTDVVEMLLESSEEAEFLKELIDLAREYYPEEADLLVANKIDNICRQESFEGKARDDEDHRPDYFRNLYSRIRKLGLDVSYDQLDAFDEKNFKGLIRSDLFIKGLLFAEVSTDRYDERRGEVVKGDSPTILMARENLGDHNSKNILRELIAILKKYYPEEADKLIANSLDRLYTQAVEEFADNLEKNKAKARGGIGFSEVSDAELETRESKKYHDVRRALVEFGLDTAYDELDSFKPDDLKMVNLRLEFALLKTSWNTDSLKEYLSLCEKHLGKEETNKIIFNALFPSLVEDEKKKGVNQSENDYRSELTLRFLKEEGYLTLDQTREMIEAGEILDKEGRDELWGLGSELEEVRKAMDIVWKDEIRDRVVVVDDLSKLTGMTHEELLKALQDPAVIEALKRAKAS